MKKFFFMTFICSVLLVSCESESLEENISQEEIVEVSDDTVMLKRRYTGWVVSKWRTKFYFDCPTSSAEQLLISSWYSTPQYQRDGAAFNGLKTYLGCR